MTTSRKIFSITIDEPKMKRIENYWYDTRCKNRNEAINKLIDQGLHDYEMKSSNQNKHTEDHAERKIHC